MGVHVMAKTLTVFLAADLKKFNGGMKDAQREVTGFGGSLKNMLGPALIAAGAAAGAFAIKLGVDGVKAAIEDQKAVEALAKTLDNLNLAHETDAIEAYIYELERAFGVADTDLRPAYDRLVRSTRDAEDANKALKLALDISAGTGKSLQTVTDALGKAYDGNTTSLGRLGLGIDQTRLKSMSLEATIETLSDTFGGQAEANARTFDGQLRRLSTAADNLKEAFGAGLLEALGDTNDTTQNLVDTMEDFEPILKGLGAAFGRFASTGLKTYTDAMRDAEIATQDTADQMAGLGKVAEVSGALIGEIFASLTGPNSPIGVVLRSIGAVTQATNELKLSADRLTKDGMPPLTGAIREANVAYQDAAVRLQRIQNEQANTSSSTTSLSRATGGASRETEKLTKAQQRLLDNYELQGIAFATTKSDLLAQIQVVEEATAAVQSYAQAIQQDLLAGIDLGSLYEAQFDEQGNRTGTSLIEGFNRAIEQAEYFGGVLTAIKAQGADQSLLEQIAGLGPDTGAALGQQLLDEGLVPEMNAKWTGVQETTRELALGLVPEFLEAGRLSAIDTLNGLATQFGKDQRKFKRLGDKLGQQVGKEFKAKMLKEIADAVRQVEALATAARAEAVARAEAEQARITEQAVASAISNLIRNSDQRAGRNVQPVIQ
jgi:molybdenum-dependent DNA-binding transcriptional regulator ModE